jgi:hypothetical protein
VARFARCGSNDQDAMRWLRPVSHSAADLLLRLADQIGASIPGSAAMATPGFWREDEFATTYALLLWSAILPYRTLKTSLADRYRRHLRRLDHSGFVLLIADIRRTALSPPD